MIGRSVQTTASRVEITNAFLRGVYQWMALGLALTAGVAYAVVSSEALLSLIFSSRGVFFGLIIAELALVFIISGAITRLSSGAASGLFLLYSALNGATLSSVLLVYTSSSVFQAFLTAAGMFAAMSIYGLTTKKDLASWSSFLFMGLIGIVLASIVNIFLASGPLDFVISGLGVVLFLGLTAYDTQYLRDMGESVPQNDATAVRRGTILGALKLYLDFINLFLMLLRFFGDRR